MPPYLYHVTYYSSRPSDSDDTPVSNSTAETSTSQSWSSTVRQGVCHRLHLLFQPPASSGSEPSPSRKAEGGAGSAGVRTQPGALQGSREALKKQTSHNAAAAAELQGASIGLPTDRHSHLLFPLMTRWSLKPSAPDLLARQCV